MLLPYCLPLLQHQRSSEYQSGLWSKVQRPFPGRSGPLLPFHNSLTSPPTQPGCSQLKHQLFPTHIVPSPVPSDWHTFSKQVWPIKILPVLNSSLLYPDTTVPPKLLQGTQDNSVFIHKNYRTGSNLRVLPGSIIFVFTCSTLNIACIILIQYLFEMKEKELLYISVHSMNISGNLKKLIFLNPTGKMTPLDTEHCHLVTSNLWGSPRTTGAVPNKISHDKGMRPFLHSFSQASRGERWIQIPWGIFNHSFTLT